MAEVELKVGGMSCDHCKMAVEQALKTLDGVKSVDIDLETGKVNVDCDDGVKEEKLKDALRQAGYELG